MPYLPCRKSLKNIGLKRLFDYLVQKRCNRNFSRSVHAILIKNLVYLSFKKCLLPNFLEILRIKSKLALRLSLGSLRGIMCHRPKKGVTGERARPMMRSESNFTSTIKSNFTIKCFYVKVIVNRCWSAN